MAEQSTHDPKIKGSNPVDAGAGIDERTVFILGPEPEDEIMYKQIILMYKVAECQGKHGQDRQTKTIK